MGWGKKRGVEDLTKKLRDNTTSESLTVLSMRNLSDGVRDFAAALGTNTSLRELLASGHSLSPDQVAYVAAALAENSTLTSLAIGSASFGDAGAAALCAGWTNRTLIRLDLGFKSIAVAGTRAVADVLGGGLCGLQDLNLARNAINDDAAVFLGLGLA